MRQNHYETKELKKPYKVKMLKTTKGRNENETSVRDFEEGQEYSIGHSLYKAFVTMGVVENAKEEEKTYEGAVSCPEEEPVDALNLEEMDKGELKELAKREFGLKFRGNPSKNRIIKSILEAKRND